MNLNVSSRTVWVFCCSELVKVFLALEAVNLCHRSQEGRTEGSQATLQNFRFAISTSVSAIGSTSYLKYDITGFNRALNLISA